MTPSKYQQAIYDFIENGTGNAIIQAVAGSGKTTTLFNALDLMKGQKVAYGVYNSANATEMKDRTGFRPGIFINTAHGFGYKTWLLSHPKCELNADKKWEIVAFHLGLLEINEETGKKIFDSMAHTVKKIITFAKNRAVAVLVPMSEKQTWLDIVEHNNIQDDFAVDGKLPVDIEVLIDKVIRLAYRGLQYSVKIAPEIIDFDDQLFMPLVGKVRFWQYDFVLIDEAQDTNPARREIFKRMLKPNGRLIAVGDPHQAIYGFTGADNNSLDLIAEEFNTVSLPLTVSYRCPKAVVAIAKRYVSHIEAADTAIEGITRKTDLKGLLTKEQLRSNDAILCRNVAPLVELAYDFLKRNIPCHVEGREIGTGLIKMVDMWKSVKTVGAFLNKLEEYRTKQVAKLTAKNKDRQAEELNDKCETLSVIASSLHSTEKLETLKVKIAVLFTSSTDEAHETLTLCTIHKSKGREWDRVFWYGANRYQPSPFAKQDWQLMQETNLMYVAATRAKVELVEVKAPPKANEREGYGA